MSGPLLDRIDALIEVAPLSLEDLNQRRLAEKSSEVAERVGAAQRFAAERVAADGREGKVSLEHRAKLSGSALGILRHALESECLGGRGYARVIRLARTIADLDASSTVESEHIAEALSLRLDHRGLGRL